MVGTTQLRLALETEEERRAKKRNEFNLYLISKPFFFSSRNELAGHVMGTIFLVMSSFGKIEQGTHKYENPKFTHRGKRFWRKQW